MRVSALFVSAALFAGALAAPMPGGTEYEFEQCNGGEIQCCNSTKSVQSLEWTTKSLLGLLGIDLKQITGLVGTECTSLNVLGIGGGSKWYVFARRYSLSEPR
ncbi:hydrophobin-251 [Coprinopsis cinerea AmutBmut pab1-1]|nr:hydrophobin-251 [Coprinopsis cinerea AmutBmut pab1-1]